MGGFGSGIGLRGAGALGAGAMAFGFAAGFLTRGRFVGRLVFAALSTHAFSSFCARRARFVACLAALLACLKSLRATLNFFLAARAFSFSSRAAFSAANALAVAPRKALLVLASLFAGPGFVISRVAVTQFTTIILGFVNL
ncbi:MAG TPA: hypothetical protein VG167_20345 [Verrucomicrobiae bacterium]|nr:hypothetical protein [Verrucomicrobiae bacterium]